MIKLTTNIVSLNLKLMGWNSRKRLNLKNGLNKILFSYGQVDTLVSDSHCWKNWVMVHIFCSMIH